MKMKAVLKLFKDTYIMKRIVIGNGYITNGMIVLPINKIKDIEFIDDELNIDNVKNKNDVWDIKYLDISNVIDYDYNCVLEKSNLIYNDDNDNIDRIIYKENIDNGYRLHYFNRKIIDFLEKNRINIRIIESPKEYKFVKRVSGTNIYLMPANLIEKTINKDIFDLVNIR